MYNWRLENWGVLCYVVNEAHDQVLLLKATCRVSYIFFPSYITFIDGNFMDSG